MSSLPSRQDTRRRALAAIQKHVGGCREELGAEANHNKCRAPAEYVLWGKLIAAEGLGPRCYDHAAKHIGHHGLASRSGWALINLNDLAADVAEAMERVDV
jgi:hypothetical protein